jgi:hypothetical protein
VRLTLVVQGMNEEEGRSGNPALVTFGERSAICTSAVTPDILQTNQSPELRVSFFALRRV